jgi:hypothetical protein
MLDFIHSRICCHPICFPKYLKITIWQFGKAMKCIFLGKKLGDNIDTIKKNTGTLIGASKEVGLEVNTEKTEYMSLPHHQNAGQNHNIKIGDRSFENVAQFEYLLTTIQSRTSCLLVCCLKT